MKLGHLKHFSSSKDSCISKYEKVLLHKQAIFSTFSDKMAADSPHFVIYCFSLTHNFLAGCAIALDPAGSTAPAGIFFGFQFALKFANLPVITRYADQLMTFLVYE